MPRLLCAVLTTVLFLASFAPVLAETMESSSYRIRMGNFNMTSGGKSSASYSLTDTVGQDAAGLFSSSGYSVKAGFQYIYTLYDFTFSVSDLSIDLGTLTPDSFSTDTNQLTVSAPGQGYAVTVFEANRLQSGSNYIPDTACNSGPCTETNAEVWTSTSSYGFGYNASGDDVDSEFESTDHFRPFPDLSLGDSAATVMESNDAGQNRTATVTYKANIEPTQAAGNYVTDIIYIATPTY